MTNKTMLTTETITELDIRKLRAEAESNGDYKMAYICQTALLYNEVDQDGNLSDLVNWTREEAREECTRVINAARAMEES